MSKSIIFPMPAQVGHIPFGLLKEKYDAGPTDGVPILEKSRRKREYISLIVPTVDLAFPPRRVWSIITDGFKLSTHSTFGFSYFGSLPLTQAL